MDTTPEKKIRVLALCDSPTSATGFAQLSRNVLRGLVATGKYEIDVIGINYQGDYYDRLSHPYNIYPAMPQGFVDMYGRGRVLNALNGVEERAGLKRGWDIVFTIQDPFIIEGLGLDYPFGEQLRVTKELWRRTLPPEFWYKWIGYFPVDSELKENWVTKSMALPDYPVFYCEWGKQKVLDFDKPEFDLYFNLRANNDSGKQKARMKVPGLAARASVIHHGVDTSAFKPLPKEDIAAFRKQFFGGKVKDSTYLVVNVSRNQPRKDLARTLAVFAEFKRRVPDSHLYLHSKANDVGGSIEELARNYDLVMGRDYTVPDDFNAGIGYPVETVNMVYNAADLCITTTLGEGWGFITTEAMATKTPIVAPYITSIKDIFGEWGEGYLENPATQPAWAHMRGIPALAGSTTSEWACYGLEDNERIRPLTNVEDMVGKMMWAYKNKGSKVLGDMIERAYSWVQELAWGNIVAQWDAVFTKAYADLVADRRTGLAIDRVGRNDPCPCGSGNKFKHCHGADDKTAKFADWLVKDEPAPDAENKR